MKPATILATTAITMLVMGLTIVEVVFLQQYPLPFYYWTRWSLSQLPTDASAGVVSFVVYGMYSFFPVIVFLGISTPQLRGQGHVGGASRSFAAFGVILGVVTWVLELRSNLSGSGIGWVAIHLTAAILCILSLGFLLDRSLRKSDEGLPVTPSAALWFNLISTLWFFTVGPLLRYAP